jgi:hypothetical protein
LSHSEELSLCFSSLSEMNEATPPPLHDLSASTLLDVSGSTRSKQLAVPRFSSVLQFILRPIVFTCSTSHYVGHRITCAVDTAAVNNNESIK